MLLEEIKRTSDTVLPENKKCFGAGANGVRTFRRCFLVPTDKEVAEYWNGYMNYMNVNPLNFKQIVN